MNLRCGRSMEAINVIYEDLGIPEHEWMELLEFAAIATVGDVMKLQDENRPIRVVKSMWKNILESR